MQDVEMILEAVGDRQANWPEEPPAFSFALVLMNIGDRYSHVSCTGGEWEGIKADVPKKEGLPTCPNGHSLTQDSGLTLGWIFAD